MKKRLIVKDLYERSSNRLSVIPEKLVIKNEEKQAICDAKTGEVVGLISIKDGNVIEKCPFTRYYTSAEEIIQNEIDEINVIMKNYRAQLKGLKELL